MGFDSPSWGTDGAENARGGAALTRAARGSVAGRMRPPSSELPALDIASAWSLLGEPVEAVEPLGRGTRSRVYRVTLADGETRVVRLSPKGTGRLAREAWVRARMANTDAPTVPAVAVTHPSLSTRADVVLMRELPGRTMDVALAGASDDAAERLWAAFGEGLAAFHAVPVEGFGLIDGAGRGAWGSWRDAMEHLASTALGVARGTELVDLCARAEARLAELAPSLERVRAPHLAHGDAQPANVQCEGERVVAWLDFEYAMGADPLYELAFVSRFFEATPWAPASPRSRARHMEAFTRGYTRRLAPVVADPERLGYYRVVHALRAAEMLRLGARSLDPARRAEAVELLRERLESALTRS